MFQLTKQLFHPVSGHCLECDATTKNLFMMPCQSDATSQQWQFGSMNVTALKEDWLIPMPWCERRHAGGGARTISQHASYCAFSFVIGNRRPCWFKPVAIPSLPPFPFSLPPRLSRDPGFLGFSLLFCPVLVFQIYLKISWLFLVFIVCFSAVNFSTNIKTPQISELYEFCSEYHKMSQILPQVLWILKTLQS